MKQIYEPLHAEQLKREKIKQLSHQLDHNCLTKRYTHSDTPIQHTTDMTHVREYWCDIP